MDKVSNLLCTICCPWLVCCGVEGRCYRTDFSATSIPLCCCELKAIERETDSGGSRIVIANRQGQNGLTDTSLSESGIHIVRFNLFNIIHSNH